MGDERTQVLCDSCFEGDHDECVEKTMGYDHNGIDVRICWCLCCDEVYRTAVTSHIRSTAPEEDR